MPRLDPTSPRRIADGVLLQDITAERLEIPCVADVGKGAGRGQDAAREEHGGRADHGPPVPAGRPSAHASHALASSCCTVTSESTEWHVCVWPSMPRVLASMRGDFAQAAAFYSNSLGAFEMACDSEPMSWVLNNLGILHTKIRNFDEASMLC